MRIALYIICIVLANVLTSMFAPFSMLGMLVPAGTFLIGFTFIMRDLVQLKVGKHKTYLVICGALILSAIATYAMGNGIRIVTASAISFALSELADTEIFTRIRASISKRVAYSGIVGSVLDSIIFTIAAGFPIQAAYGQTIVKVIMQGLGAVVIKNLPKAIESTESAQAEEEV